MRRIVAATAAAVVMLAAVAADAKEWTKIRFGVEGAYPPFSEVSPDGQLKGFDIDIANALCAEMKAECTLVQQDWDGIIPALLARKYDAIIASMSITEERKQKVDISPEAMKGKKVGVQRATIHDRFLTETYGDAIEIVRYASQDEAYLDLASGRVDALVVDSLAVKLGFLDTERGKDFALAGPPLSDPRWWGQGAGIAVRKQDGDLREQLNAAIAAIRQNGTWEKLKQQYFGDIDIWGEPTS